MVFNLSQLDTSLSSTIENSRKKKKTTVLVVKEFAQAVFNIQVIMIINRDNTNKSCMLTILSLRVKITCADGAIKL